MSDSDEVEEFDVNDEDMRRAMNSNYHRKNSRVSKEDAMLGVFAQNDDSDEDYGAGDSELLKSFNHKGGGRTSKSTTSINFVSKSSKDTKDSIKKEEVKKKKEPIIVDTYVSTEEENSDFDEDAEEEEEEEKNNNQRSDFRDPLPTPENNEEIKSKMHGVDLNALKKPKQNITGPTFSEKKTSLKKEPTLNKSEQKDVGNWEKYEKGFGSKMLLKMGWQKGKGLGKEGQGRAVPVEATLRKGKGAVGKYGPESKDLKRFQSDDDESDDDYMGKKQHVSQWKNKNKQGSSKNLQYNTIRTPEELLTMASNNQKKLRKAEQILDNKKSEKEFFPVPNMTKMKIIDMTGREQKVIHGYENISSMGAQNSSSSMTSKVNFDLPELVKNLDILVNMTEEKIIQSEKKMKHFDDMVVNLTYEETCHHERITQEKTQIEKIENILNVIQRCEILLAEQTELEEMINIFTELKSDYPDEFLIFNLSQVAIPLFTPILKQKMKLWRPFSDDKDTNIETSDMYCYDLYADLKNIFRDSNHSINPFHRLIWETWMLSFRKLIQQESIRHATGKCVLILEKWSNLLPKYILENIIEQHILVKLNYEVESWNPLIDTVAIHIWIHPWLPMMKDRMDSALFPTIRFKLSNALCNWHPADVSAKAILLPWRPPVFSTGGWDTFMCKNIIPKLEIVLSNELIINPSDQDLNPWKWIMSWYDLVPLASLVTILDRSFFPKWLNVLNTWLSSTPNYKEISKWYMGWKALFPEKLVNHPGIKAKLTQGLIMMNRSVNGGPNTDTFTEKKRVGPVAQVCQATTRDINNLSGIQIQSMASSRISSFKDMIEKKAAEHNLLFLPVQNRLSKEGQQVYRFGNLNVYIEKNVIFMLQNGNWIPTSISEIVPKAY